MKNNRFKKYILPLNILIVSLSSSWINVYAANGLADNPLQVHLLGEITFYACGIAATEENKYINLGQNATRELKSVGDKSVSMPIPFTLMDCPPDSPVTITFEGPRDALNNGYLAIESGSSAATNVAIEMLDSKRNHLPFGQKSNFTSDANGNLSTQFYAHYIVTRTSSTPGIVKAKATFLIEYQ